MSDNYDNLYCEESFLDDAPLPIQDDEEDAWYDLHSDMIFI